MTRAEFERMCADICPTCKAGVPVRQRSNREWVHDQDATKRGFAHSLCLAHYFRNEHESQVSG